LEENLKKIEEKPDEDAADVEEIKDE